MLSRPACASQRQQLFLARGLRQSASPGNTAVRTASRSSRLAKFAAYSALGVSGTYLFDKYLNASAIGRNVRTLYTGAVIALDYKLNFNATNSESIPALQERVAERLYNLLVENGGLYIKIGQAIGANAAILPEPFRQRFGRLFDDAPTIPYEEVEGVIKREFGRGVEDIFAEFERVARASASVAQVHRARLKDGGGEDGKGTWVAVKIQKPAVTKQVNWDLAAYKMLMWCYDKVFPMPVYFLADFIASHLRRELDFESEARNAMHTSECINSPNYSSLDLKGRVYVPKVYESLTTKCVMTAEWIEGVRMSDRKMIDLLTNGGGALPDGAVNWDGGGYSKEAQYLRDNLIPTRGGKKAIMKSMVDLFCAQMFIFGFIHCDPHPGNIIIRRIPKTNTSQLVLLDHGLYVQMSPKFRTEYAALWEALLTLDWDVIRDIGKEWGIGSPEMFASATLMRPVRMENGDQGKAGTPEKLSQFEMAERMKEHLKKFLTDTDRMPKELVFLGRNMRIVQGNNQSMGSPVNRIRITAQWASKSRAYNSPVSIPSRRGMVVQTETFMKSLAYRLQATYHHLVFMTILAGMDLLFYLSKIRQWWRKSQVGWEDELEQGMRGFAKDNLGFDIGEGAFEG